MKQEITADVVPFSSATPFDPRPVPRDDAVRLLEVVRPDASVDGPAGLASNRE